MVGKAAIIGGTVVIIMLGLGSFLLLNSTVPLERKHVILDDTFSVVGRMYENRTAWIDSSGEYVASFTVSEGTLRSSLMVGGIFQLWAEGKYEPQWIESNQGDYGTGVSLGDEGVTMYFIFFNNDTLTKQVHLEAARIWEETKYPEIFGGAMLVLSGGIAGLILMYRRKNL